MTGQKKVRKRRIFADHARHDLVSSGHPARDLRHPRYFVAPSRRGLTSRKAGAAHTIRATSRKLKPGRYQLQIAVTNQAPYGVVVDELRRVRPRAARLIAPIRQVGTR